MPQIGGDIKGLNHTEIKQLEKLYSRKLGADQIISYELAEELCEQTLKLKRPLFVVFDLQGRVQQVWVGNSLALQESGAFSPPARQAGLNNYYGIQTYLGWEPTAVSEQIILLQYHLPVIGILMAGLSEGFSQAHGEHPHFCDGGVLLHVGQAEQGQLLIAESAEPQTARSLSKESLETWLDWGRSIYQSYQSVQPKKGERALLVGVYPTGSEGKAQAQEYLEELAQLAKTAGAHVVGTLTQFKSHPDNKTYLGKGKVDELALLAQTHQVEIIIVDDELSPGQQRNLEAELQVKVIDRTELILDIFAQRAQSREGKIQVSLAQLQYMLPRLMGRGRMFSQQTASGAKGRIATRGPGETKLETDRRAIRDRVTQLKKEAASVQSHRQFQRQQRRQSYLPTVALVGYTNAGKSTLMKALTQADVLVEDKLFATLDPTTRKLYLPGGNTVLLVDTVGFIRKLPTFLVDAFRSTLEEITEADLLIHVWDVHSPEAEEHRQVVLETLEALEAGNKPLLTACNKMDQPDALGILETLPDSALDRFLPISALTKQGLPDLLVEIEKQLTAHNAFSF